MFALNLVGIFASLIDIVLIFLPYPGPSWVLSTGRKQSTPKASDRWGGGGGRVVDMPFIFPKQINEECTVV